MTPEELGKLHPWLYHLTTPASVSAILARGLLSTVALLDLYQSDSSLRRRVLARRPAEIFLDDPALGRTVINDNLPLSDKALGACLLDGLSPDDWRRMLNERVFLWADVRGLEALRGAQANAERQRSVIVVRTKTLAEAHAERIEITPFNTGNTRRRPTLRGRATFAPLLATDYRTWRKSRKDGSLDSIREVTVLGGIPDIADHVEVVVTGTSEVLATWAAKRRMKATV